jgi:hypothetical protein
MRINGITRTSPMVDVLENKSSIAKVSLKKQGELR